MSENFPVVGHIDLPDRRLEVHTGYHPHFDDQFMHKSVELAAPFGRSAAVSFMVGEMYGFNTSTNYSLVDPLSGELHGSAILGTEHFPDQEYPLEEGGSDSLDRFIEARMMSERLRLGVYQSGRELQVGQALTTIAISHYTQARVRGRPQRGVPPMTGMFTEVNSHDEALVGVLTGLVESSDKDGTREGFDLVGASLDGGRLALSLPLHRIQQLIPRFPARPL